MHISTISSHRYLMRLLATILDSYIALYGRKGRRTNKARMRTNKRSL